MKKISLTQDKFALISNRDYASLSKFKWCALRHGKTFVAVRKYKGKVVKMHRFLLNPDEGIEIDHKDGNGLNNQRSNLRICTRGQNNQNRGKPDNNTSGLKGVYWHKTHKCWTAAIGVNGEQVWLGTFSNKRRAYQARLDAGKKYHGIFSSK